MFLLALLTPLATAFQTSQHQLAPAIWTQPIEVVVWVHDNVSVKNEAQALDGIREGLDLWEDIPTSELSFVIVDVIRAAGDPGHQPHQLQINVVNRADATNAGASGPDAAGNPGQWFGCVADQGVNLPPVTAHEVGHALGFAHSTVSVAFDSAHHGVMHWASSYIDDVNVDDVAAATALYPTQQIVADFTGTVTGRMLSRDTSLPVDGLNVVAVDASGVPHTAQITGTNGAADGEFTLHQLAPGDYVIQVLDGHSYKGSVGVSPEPTWDGGYQADNFDMLEIPVTVGIVETVDLGDVSLQLHPMQLTNYLEGSFTSGEDVDTPLGTDLPDGRLYGRYDVWIEITGGHRGLSLSSSGLPWGVSAEVSVGSIYGVDGAVYVHVEGVPALTGVFDVQLTLEDKGGFVHERSLALTIDP